MVHIFLSSVFFYYLEEVMDHKILIPPPTWGGNMKFIRVRLLFRIFWALQVIDFFFLHIFYRILQ